MAGIPSGEIKNDIIRNTTQPSFEPEMKIKMLNNTPMTEAISRKVFAQQKRNVRTGLKIVNVIPNGTAIILNNTLNKVVIKIPLSWRNTNVLSYTYILPFKGHGPQCCRDFANFVL